VIVFGPAVGGVVRGEHAAAARACERVAGELAAAGWRVATAVATPTAIARALDGEPAIVVVVGAIATTADGAPALATDAAWLESRAGSAMSSMSAMSSLATGLVPLAELQRAARAVASAVIVVAGWPIDAPVAGAAASWLAAMATTRRDDVVAAVAGASAGAAVVAVIDALAGAGVRAPDELRARLSAAGAEVARVADAHEDDAALPDTSRSDAAPRDRVRPARAPTSPDEDLSGTTLPGRFRLDERIARGGFGTVYRGHQLAIERDVAVKVLHADVALGSASGRLFVDEIRAVGRVDHPNVVRIFHADVTGDGRLFFAMELLAGDDLERVVARDGKLPRARAIALAQQLLAGLRAAHDAGIVHADIKPANALLVAGSGGERLVLVDFGLARVAGEARASGGTPAYMAPEQLRDGRVDARSDLFSAALVIVTLLTGWRRRTRDELAPPPAVLAALDRPLRAALARTLELEPDARFQTVSELAVALAAAPTPRPRRRVARAAVAAAIAVAGAGAIGVEAIVAGSERATPSSTASSDGATGAPARPVTVAHPMFPDRPTVAVGGSGTLLWGFFAPLASFLEIAGKLVIPITSQNDVGSGGALAALADAAFDIAALSRRAAPDTLADARAAGKVLVEVAIGFDDTSLFVARGTPVTSLDVADIRAHLCCPRGALMQPTTWRDLGVSAPAIADQRVTWLLFGRRPLGSAPLGPLAQRETTSATLALADDWLCAPDRMCPAAVQAEVQANEILPTLVADATDLALSSRSFATPQVAPVAITDRAHHAHLDGRKTLWLYALVPAKQPIPDKLCRLFSVVLDDTIADRLAKLGKAAGLPDAARRRQRAALGLDDGRCASAPVGELARGDSVLASPIADELEVAQRWAPD
jgi:hypothetical protein